MKRVTHQVEPDEHDRVVMTERTAKPKKQPPPRGRARQTPRQAQARAAVQGQKWGPLLGAKARDRLKGLCLQLREQGMQAAHPPDLPPPQDGKNKFRQRQARRKAAKPKTGEQKRRHCGTWDQPEVVHKIKNLKKLVQQHLSSNRPQKKPSKPTGKKSKGGSDARATKTKTSRDLQCCGKCCERGHSSAEHVDGPGIMGNSLIPTTLPTADEEEQTVTPNETTVAPNPEETPNSTRILNEWRSPKWCLGQNRINAPK